MLLSQGQGMLAEADSHRTLGPAIKRAFEGTTKDLITAFEVRLGLTFKKASNLCIFTSQSSSGVEFGNWLGKKTAYAQHFHGRNLSVIVGEPAIHWTTFTLTSGIRGFTLIGLVRGSYH